MNVAKKSWQIRTLYMIVAHIGRNNVCYEYDETVADRARFAHGYLVRAAV